MTSCAKSAEPPLAAEGGLQTSLPRRTDDPYRTLDELMSVVEALCPVWPERPTFTASGRFLM